MTTRLHGISNGSKNGMEDGGGGGGGGYTLRPHSFETWDKCLPPPPPPPHTHTRTQISEFDLGLGGGTKVFYPQRPDYRRFKIPSFTSPGHTHSHVCAPTATFSFCRKVIRYQLGNLGIIIKYHIYSQYHKMREKSF